MNGVWRPIPDAPGYSISNTGTVYCERLQRTLRQSASGQGYLIVGVVYGDGVRRLRLVHRLVLAAFVGPCPEGMEGCHNDGNPINNAIENLRWDTRSGNVQDAIRHGTNSRVRQTHCKWGHEFTPENTGRTAPGNRYCLTCNRARAAAARARRAQAA